MSRQKAAGRVDERSVITVVVPGCRACLPLLVPLCAVSTFLTD
jgi:hypothetical protein